MTGLSGKFKKGQIIIKERRNTIKHSLIILIIVSTLSVLLLGYSTPSIAASQYIQWCDEPVCITFPAIREMIWVPFSFLDNYALVFVEHNIGGEGWPIRDYHWSCFLVEGDKYYSWTFNCGFEYSGSTQLELSPGRGLVKEEITVSRFNCHEAKLSDCTYYLCEDDEVNSTTHAKVTITQWQCAIKTGEATYVLYDPGHY